MGFLQKAWKLYAKQFGSLIAKCLESLFQKAWKFFSKNPWMLYTKNIWQFCWKLVSENLKCVFFQKSCRPFSEKFLRWVFLQSSVDFSSQRLFFKSLEDFHQWAWKLFSKKLGSFSKQLENFQLQASWLGSFSQKKLGSCSPKIFKIISPKCQNTFLQKLESFSKKNWGAFS